MAAPSAAGPNGDTSPSGQQLSFPSVLHFLQREWVNYNKERTWWLAEKAELQARIAFLEGQRVGEANLKRDLMRRIKMLEHALQQERAKSNGKDPTSPPPFQRPQQSESAAKKKPSGASREVREGRQILLQYLSEMQYTDAVIEAQAQRVRGLLKSWAPTAVDPFSKRPNPACKAENSADEVQETEPDESGEYISVEPRQDDDSENANNAFTLDMPDGVTKATETSANRGALEVEEFDPNAEQEIPEELPIVDPNAKHKAGEAISESGQEVQVQAAADDDDPYANGDDAALQERIAKQFGSAGSKMMKRVSKSKRSRKPKAADLFAEPSTGSMESKMGELFDLDVSNPSATSSGNDKRKASASSSEATTEIAARKSWKANKEFRGHLDSVRSVSFHPKEPFLVSCGEDALVKVWRSEAKRSADPVRTLRGHTGPVLASTFSRGGALFTSGADSKIISWQLPQPDADTYCDYTPSSRLCTADGHTDSIWMLDAHPTNDIIVSGGADGTFRFWDVSNPSSISMKQSFQSPNGAISCGEFSVTDNGKLVVGNQDGHVSLVDIESGEDVVKFPLDEPATLFSLRVHKTMSLAVAAYSNKKIKFFDCTSGKIVHSLVAHQAAVSCIDFDPSGLYMVSVGHDRSIRMWDVATKSCVFENTTHRQKFDEAIHAVSFHPSVAKFATAGADAVVKVYT